MSTILNNAAAVVTILAALLAAVAGFWRVLRKLDEILRALRQVAHHELRITRIERHLNLPPLVIPEP